MQLQSPGREDLLEEGTATHSSTCLKNHMDTGAWQAAAHRVSQSQTRLKRLNTLARRELRTAPCVRSQHETGPVLVFGGQAREPVRAPTAGKADVQMLLGEDDLSRALFTRQVGAVIARFRFVLQVSRKRHPWNPVLSVMFRVFGAPGIWCQTV